MRKQLSSTVAWILRLTTAILVVFSITVTYFVMIVENRYEIFTNPGGPDTEEYFNELYTE